MSHLEGRHPAPSVFLDWFGTIADRTATPQHYGRVMAHLLHEWYGVPVEAGLQAHDEALEWYMQEWRRRLEGATDYAATFREMQIEYISRLERLYGRRLAETAEDAFALSLRLDYAVASRIDTTYPDVRPCLRALKEMVCRVFPASGADRNYMSGLLRGAGLEAYFDAVITFEDLNAHKWQTAFWLGLLDKTRSEPRLSVAVDDDPRALERARDAGIHCLLVDRVRQTSAEAAAFLRLPDLSGLPRLVAGVSESWRTGLKMG